MSLLQTLPRPLVISEYLSKHYAFKMGVVKIEKF